MSMPVTGRFAPTPSGRLHLGNLLCALLAYLSARHADGRFLLRIEDLDAPRCPKRLCDAAIQDLTWLGITWDELPLFSKVNAGKSISGMPVSLSKKGCSTPAFVRAHSFTPPPRPIAATTTRFMREHVRICRRKRLRSA